MEIVDYFKSFNPANTKFQDFQEFLNDSSNVKLFMDALKRFYGSNTKMILKVAKGKPILPEIPLEELYPTLFATNISAIGIPYRDIKNTFIIVEANTNTMKQVKHFDIPFQIQLLETMSSGPIQNLFEENNNLEDEELKLVFIYLTDAEEVKGSKRFEDIYNDFTKH